MSIDVCNNRNSILLKKATAAKNDSTKDTKAAKKSRSSSFSKLQTLVASVSKRRTKQQQKDSLECNSNVPSPTPQPSPMLAVKAVEVTSAAQIPPSNLKLKPSLSARPFSQFFFPSVKEEEDEETTDTTTGAATRATIARQISFSPPSSLQQKQQKQQQQTKNRQFNRHSIAIDYIDRQQQQTEESTSSNSSSRSSSLKTIRLLDDLMIKEEDEEEEIINTVQSEITLSSASFKKNYCLSRSISQNKEKRLSGVVNVARARTVLGLDSLKSKETRAIHVWKNTITQLLSTNPDRDYMLDNDKRDLYKIITHPALIVSFLFFLFFFLLI
jgi:hypothetical protein